MKKQNFKIEMPGALNQIIVSQFGTNYVGFYLLAGSSKAENQSLSLMRAQC